MNVNRSPGSRVMQPTDFVREPVKVVSPDEMEAMLDAWMVTHNADAGG